MGSIKMKGSKGSWEHLSKPIHENLSKLFRSRKGETLTTAEIERLYRAEYNHPDVMWVQPPDHCSNWNTTKDWYCKTCETDGAIFERIKRGLYKVRE
jgi:hypothetical protein